LRGSDGIVEQTHPIPDQPQELAPAALEPAVPISPLLVFNIPNSTELPAPVAPAAEQPLGEATQPSAASGPDAAHTRSAAGSGRRLMEVAVLFVCAILFLRALAVEPFGVPTGSMAPTLIGNHRCAHCPRCGYEVRIGEPFHTHRGASTLSCPNCGQTGLPLEGLPEIAGDRLLVDKNVFNLRNPRRWEVAVFRCPADLTKPYVKRVIGLPGEQVFIHDGDIYINGELARKTLADCRQTCVPVFEMKYVPGPTGWQERWLFGLQPGVTSTNGVAGAVVSGGDLRLDGTRDPSTTAWATYRHFDLDSKQETGIHDGFAYNGLQAGPTYAVHDFLVSFDVEVLAGSGALHCRLTDGLDTANAYLAVGVGTEQTRLVQESVGVVRSAGKRLEAGKSYRVEMAFIDRRVSVAVDGSEPFSAFDLPAGPSRSQLEVSRPLSVGVQGVSAIVRNLRLCRDIYYRSAGQHAVQRPLTLGQNEYFMLGDNSANSDDGRSWQSPAVPERNFLGKPFLLHQPSRLGRVELGGWTREFQSLDWDRIRWLR
jgi:signal peptidase I